MPTSKDFRGSGSHRQLFCPYWGPLVWHSCWVNEQGKPASQKPLTAEKQSIKRQLHTTHVGAVGWEPHSSSTMTCAGKVDHKLPVNQSKGHSYTNPRPSHYLTHAHSHITQAGSHRQRFRSYWGSTAWHGHRSVTGETCVKRPFPAEVSPLSASSTPHMWSCWLGTAQQLYHNMSGEGRSRVWCMCAPYFNLSFENSELNCSTT